MSSMIDEIITTDTSGTSKVKFTSTGLRVDQGGLSLNDTAPVAGQLTGATVVSPTITGATMTTATLTAPTITSAVVTDATETVAATNVIAATETGKTFFLNHATEFVSTLPAPAAGLRFTFVVTGAPSGADYTITTTSSDNIISSSSSGNFIKFKTDWTEHIAKDL